MTRTETLNLYQQTPTRCFALAKNGDIVIATPFIWEKLTQAGLQFHPGVLGITSGGPSTAETWSALDRSALSGLIEIYGATETGGVGFRTSADAAFKLLSHLEHANQSIRAKGVTLDVQDKLVWIGSHHFDVIGRKDDVVQVAGVNVSPAYVTRMIRKIEGVEKVDVRMKGDRLQALIVPVTKNGPMDPIARKIRDHIARNLPPPARPSTITFRTSLPCTDMGKIVDWT